MRTKRGFECRGISKGSSNSKCSPASTCPTLFSKRGQVTIFIIVGIAILFIFAGILYFSKSTVKERLTAEGDPVLAQVSQEFMPLQSYTENCLNQIGRRGLRILGEQGGYIYPNLVGEYSASNPTDADGLDLEPAKVPYWHYNAEPNSVNKISFSSLQPKLYAAEDSEMSIEAQLGRYVNEKLPACLDKYEPFLGQGFQVEIISGPETEAKIGESTVNLLLNLEVDATKGEARQTMEQFYVKVPLKLKQYYEVAEEIRKAEQNYSFMERQGLDLIAVYSDVDPAKLPPMDAVAFDAFPQAYWSEAEVKEKVRGMLISNVPLLRYLGGSNFYRYEYRQDREAVLDLRDLYQKNYDNMILPLEKGNGLEVSFDYFGWEPYFDLNDRGGKIEPFNYPVQAFILNFATQHYLTTYDISYPVLVTLRDPAALDGEGFNFVFALESNIRNNELVEPEQVLPAPVAAVRQALACDESKWNTQLLRTVVVDSSSLEPLEAVQIGFSIPEQTDCMIGLTDAQGELDSKYPAVYGGVASFIKEDYLTNFYPIDTYNFRQQPGIIGYAVASYPEPAVELHKFKPINITVKKKTLEKCISGQCFSQALFSDAREPIYSYEPAELGSTHSWTFVNVAKPLTETETATVLLNRVGDLQPGMVSDDFSATAAVTGTGSFAVDLVPGIYEVSALLTSETAYAIPEEERCTDDIILGFGETCFTLDETVMDKLLEGQLQWDTSSTYVRITPEQLYGSGELTIYVLAFNPYAVPEMAHYRVIEDLQVMGQLGNFSQILRGELEPRFR